MQLLSHCRAPAPECSRLRSRCASAAAATAGSGRGTGAEGERERTARERREGRKRVITGGRRGGAHHPAPGCPHPGRGLGAREELWSGQGGRGTRDTPGCPRHWARLWRGMRRHRDQASLGWGLISPSASPEPPAGSWEVTRLDLAPRVAGTHRTLSPSVGRHTNLMPVGLGNERLFQKDG